MRTFEVGDRVTAFESGETGTVRGCQTDPITGHHFYRVELDGKVWWTFGESQLDKTDALAWFANSMSPCGSCGTTTPDDHTDACYNGREKFNRNLP